MPDRRRFLAIAGRLASTSLLIAASGATRATANSVATGQALEIDGVQVRWQHAPDHFAARLTTPSPGWLALGFNDRPALVGTRFVIADVTAPDVRVSERIALVPDHAPVAASGLAPALLDADGRREDGRSVLELRLSRAIDARPRLRLQPGSRIHLMLAWSRSSDFGHHSAWRRHLPVTL